ncbi:MAG TPA: tRNA uridine-5-carboxymethylaminomethyl(34) synthesis GTPase MnmE, partial [Granulicella sp.]|nr:tRNA uridine-5-carboxymethylaminomethyl(34) synthesis GTPase MnmE [Granulicella sp.]
MAISTPPGRGGIGIVRLSGPEARTIAETLVRLRRPLEPGRARFGEVLEGASGEDVAGQGETAAVLDEAVVTWFRAPHSYTSEDVVEIAGHGAPVLLAALLRQCVARGARLAEPGEFTQRAFLSGRIDLPQAEAVQDLIQATTLEQARTAARQLGGALSKQVQPMKTELIALIATLEAGIDFAEDDIDLLPEAEIGRRIGAVAAPLEALEETFAYGRVLREGFRLALAGRPNAGKSSLFNRLIRRDRAIVTAQPGTTRDPITEQMELGGIPVELIDTAGLRASHDEAEQMGIAKSREAMVEADVVLLVLAANEPLDAEDVAALEATRARGLQALVVINKMDLSAEPSVAERSLAGLALGEDAVVRTCALDGTGVAALREAILGQLRSTPPSADSAILTNLRQHQAVSA